MGNNQSWYWTVERLTRLRRIIEDVVQHDQQGFFIGPVGLKLHIRMKGVKHGFRVPEAQISNGMRILVHLGVLEPSRSGRVGRGYRRWYDPEKRITEYDIQRYRRMSRQQRLEE